MTNPRNGRGRSLFRTASIGLALAVVGTAMTVAPALAVGGKSPATVTLSSSVPTGLVTGQAVAFTATVTASPGPATGSIVFSVVGADGTAATCDGGDTQPVSTSGGVTTAVCNFTDGLEAGALYYKVSATLVDPKYEAPTASLVQQIRKAETDTMVSGLPGSVIASEALSFTATVQDISPGTGSPTGSMQFAICPNDQSPPCKGYPGGAAVMPAPTPAEEALNENVITFSLPSGVLKPGAYDVLAIYVGDSSYRSSPSSLSNLLVTKVPSTVSVVPSRNPAYSNGRLVLRAVITADPRATPSLGGPSGTVTYTVTGASGNSLVCRQTGTDVIKVGNRQANQGVTRCKVSGELSVADSPYTVTAVYSGDSRYDAATGSGTVSVVSPPS